MSKCKAVSLDHLLPNQIGLENGFVDLLRMKYEIVGGLHLFQMTFLRKTVQALFGVRFVASTCIILLFDLATFSAISESPRGINLFQHADKVLHGLGFFFLSVVGFLALNFDWFRKNRDSYFSLGILNGIIWLLYGAGIEWLHLMLPYRSASLGDFLADSVGVILGVLLVWSQKLYPEVVFEK